MNYDREVENGGCLVPMVFPVVSSWIWIAAAIFDFRFWLGGLLGTAIFLLISFKTRAMRYSLSVFTLVLGIACVIAAITNLLVGCSWLLSILVPIGMISGIAVVYKLYEENK